MSKDGIWMPLYIGDYLADTMHLSTEQHGAYLLIIMAYWRNRGPLKDDDEHLANICRMMVESWTGHRPTIESLFDLKSRPGWWVHGRIDKELADATKRREVGHARGKAGAKRRWDKNA